MDRRFSVRPRHAIFAVAFLGTALRAGFVAWAAGAPEGDGLFYHFLSIPLLEGRGYLEPDGSPGIQWMPGWPATLAAIYKLFGPEPRAAMYVNALLGGATSGSIVVLGRRLFGPGVGLLAGIVYACWPGNIYYAATLLTESLFNFVLVAFLTALAIGATSEGGKRTAWFTTGGFLFGLLGMVRSEPLALGAMLFAFLFAASRSRREFVGHASLVAAALALVMLPWIVRNYVTFERLIVTSGSGGAIAWLGNHPGAAGTNEILAMRGYVERHRLPTHAGTVLAMNRAGWRDTRRFVREHPREWLELVGRKLRVTYRSDDAAVSHLRGWRDAPSPRAARPQLAMRLRALANAYWYGVLALSAVGLLSVRRFRPEALVLVFGLLATWLALHAVFLGGARFHVPEQPVFALLAACGIERSTAAVRRIRASLSD
jgi:hypothetical protein